MNTTAHPRDQLSAYLDGALTPAERTAVDAHLDACADCRARLAELRRVSTLLASLADPMPSRRLVPRLATVPAWLAPLRTLATIASGVSVFLFMASAILANIGFLAQTSGSAALAPAPAASGAAQDRAAGPVAPSAEAKVASASPGALAAVTAAPTPVPPSNAFAAQAPSPVPATGFTIGPSPWMWLVLAIVMGAVAVALQRRLRSV